MADRPECGRGWRPVSAKTDDSGLEVLLLPLEAAAAEAGGRAHLVLLLDQFPAVLGGGERVVLRTAALLQSAGYRVSIVTFQAMCAPEVLQAACCPVYLLPMDSVFSAAALKSAWRFGRFLRRTRASVAITFFESSNLFGGLAIKALSKTRLIWNRRDMGILRERKHWLAYRWLPWLPDYVIAVSEEVRRHAIEVDRIPARRVGVVYNGVDAPPPVERLISPGRPCIVTVGNVRPVKGHDVLVEAAGMVMRAHPEAEFAIAGDVLDAAFAASLKERIAALGVADRVRMLGEVRDPRALLGQASVFVLPSRSEGFSNAIVEAMMAGLPVVATAVGGNAEAVVEGETGLLVPPGNPEALAAALLQLLADPERARRMGEAGRERAVRLFSSEGMLARLEEIFVAVDRI